MATSPDDRLFGRIALHYKLLTKDQLVDGLQQQAREGGARRIGEILIEKGYITPERFERLLEIQRQYLAKQQGGSPAPSPGTPEPTPGPIEAVRQPALVSPPASPSSAALAPSAASRATTPALSSSVGTPVGDLAALFTLAVERGASDVHLHAGLPVRFRIHGEFRPIDDVPLSAERTEELLRPILTPTLQRELDAEGQVDLSQTLSGVARFRGNVYRQQNGLDGVFRAIPLTPPSLTDLGLPLDLARLANYHQGLVLLTGPAGSGKSTTLAALVRIVNEERRDHVITVEDPIEYVHRSQRSLINQREVGRDTESFARALRAALREDPDVIVVGELRDLETISLALTAAETGHLVLATLHTKNSIATINRMIGVFPPDQQSQVRTMVSESLRAIVSQRLVPRADRPGRVPALEILVSTRAVSNLVRESKTFQIRSILQTGGSQGMCALDSSLARLVKEGAIRSEIARSFAEDPKRFGA